MKFLFAASSFKLGGSRRVEVGVLGCRVSLALALAVMAPSVCFAQAVGYATIEAVHAGDIGDPWLADPSDHPEITKQLLVRLQNGTEITLPSIEGQVGFSIIEIARNRSMIGWAVEQNVCSQSYPCPTEVRVRRADGSVRDFAPDGVVWDRAFSSDGSNVVVHSGPTHGDTEGYYSLFAIKTGRWVALYAIGIDGPEWVENYLSRFVR